jgi:two-component system response regulator NreC
MSAAGFRIALIDDHAIFREGLRALLARQNDLEVIGEANEARAAYALADRAAPDLIVLDIALPGCDGIAVARELIRREPSRRILMLSMFDDQERVARALEAGALGYATKEQSAEEVVAAIRTVASGKAYLAPQISRFVIEDYMRLRKGGDPASPLRALTGREREIFDLTVRGFSSQAIASQLSISRRTVETHRSRILHKLNLHSASDLVRLAARLGLLPV